MARFPDLRIERAFTVFPGESSDGLEPDDEPVRSALPAYSGGTVWAFHPLRVAAGASVELFEPSRDV